MAGELTLDAQNSPILAFFDFLVPEGCQGCSEQASKTLVKKKFGIFFFFEIFEKSADFATNFGWGISATKGPFGFFQKIGYFLCVQLYTRSAGLFRGWVGPALIAGNP